MVSQLSERFDFMKQLPKEELVCLKKELIQIMHGGTIEEMPELSKMYPKQWMNSGIW